MWGWPTEAGAKKPIASSGMSCVSGLEGFVALQFLAQREQEGMSWLKKLMASVLPMSPPPLASCKAGVMWHDPKACPSGPGLCALHKSPDLGCEDGVDPAAGFLA